jgi:hypothetical protein
MMKMKWKKNFPFLATAPLPRRVFHREPEGAFVKKGNHNEEKFTNSIFFSSLAY